MKKLNYFCFLLVFTFLTLQINAQNLKKGFKYLAKNEIIDAYKIFNEGLATNPNCPVSNYGFAVIYSEKVDTVDFFRAYNYIQKSKENVNQLVLNKEYKKLDDYITTDSVVLHEKKIDLLLSTYVLKSKNISHVNRFLSSCENSKYYNSIIELRDSLEFVYTDQHYSANEYDIYLKTFPKSQYCKQAIAKRDFLIFEKVKKENTLESYKNFIHNYPNSEFIKEAKEQYLILDYSNVEQKKSTSECIRFMNEYPNTKQSAKCKELLMKIEFEKLTDSSTVKDYEDFINKYPDSKDTTEARQRIQKLEYAKLTDSSTIKDYEYFINKYPEFKYIKEAKQKLEKQEYLSALSSSSLTDFEAFMKKYQDKTTNYYRQIDSLYQEKINPVPQKEDQTSIEKTQNKTNHKTGTPNSNKFTLTKDPIVNAKNYIIQKEIDLAIAQFKTAMKTQPDRGYEITDICLFEGAKLLKTGYKNDADKLYNYAIDISKTNNLSITTTGFSEYFKAINDNEIVFNLIVKLIPYFPYYDLSAMMILINQSDTKISNAYLLNSLNGYCHTLWLLPTDATSENYHKLFGLKTFNPIVSNTIKKMSLSDIYSITPKTFVRSVQENALFYTENYSSGLGLSSIAELSDFLSKLKDKNELQIAAERDNYIKEIIKLRDSYLRANIKYISTKFEILGKCKTQMSFYDVDKQELGINLYLDCPAYNNPLEEVYIATVNVKLTLNEAQKFFENEESYWDTVRYNVTPGNDRKALGYDIDPYWVMPNLNIVEDPMIIMKNSKGIEIKFKVIGLHGILWPYNVKTDLFYIDRHNIRNLTGINIKQLKEIDDAKTKEISDLKKYLSDHEIKTKSTNSGLYYIETKKGIGIKAEKFRKVKVNYVGKLLNGKVFDTNIADEAKKAGIYNEKRPYVAFEFELGKHEVIKGWDEGINMMKVGGKAIFIVPSSLGYGENGAGGVIPPFSPLIFEVELIGVK